MNTSSITKITSWLKFLGKILHLVGCATVCGKSEVMLRTTYGRGPGGCNLKINKMTPIETVQYSKSLWDDQRPGFYGNPWKTFLWGVWEDWKIPIIVGSSLSTVTAVLHSKRIWAKLFHQDILSFCYLKPIFPGWTHLFPSWKMQQSKLCILNWKIYKNIWKLDYGIIFST